MIKILVAMIIFLAHGNPVSARRITSRCKSNKVLREIYLVRHGQTDWNVEGKVQGDTDIPLNKEGEEQASKLKEKLRNINFSAVYSSDRVRTHRTAEIILGEKQVPIIQTPELRNRFIGSWEGRLTRDFKKKFEGADLFNKPKDIFLTFKFDDIESYADTYKRIKKFITSLLSSSQGSPILLSSHSGVLSSVLYTLDFRPGLTWKISNCAMLTLQVKQNGEISLIGRDGVQPVRVVSIKPADDAE